MKSCLSLRPANTGSTAEIGKHNLEAIEGRFNDLVWRCTHCGKRGVDTDVFEDLDCE